MQSPLFIAVISLLIANACPAQLPIKPARTISFTTDEGSYMNVDVSPDGKTLAFDLLGDLYTVPATGGAATQITRGLAINLRPVWSPDSKRLAYVSDFSGSFHVNVRDLSGRFHRVLGKSDNAQSSEYTAVWTPNGFFVANENSLYSLSGGKLSSIWAGRIVRFSKEGNLLWYIDSAKLFALDLTTKNSKLITSLTENSKNGKISPDGRWWVFIDELNANKSLIALNIETHEQKVLVNSLLESPSYQAFVPSRNYSFSSDSKFIFISYKGKIHRISISDGDDRVIPFKAKVKCDLGPLNYNSFRVTHEPFNIKYIRSVHASPDGKELVFSALNRIYVKKISDGKVRNLVQQSINQYQPIYSPDGNWIAYVSWCDTIGGHLWKISKYGGVPQQLTKLPGQYQNPAWSPDGKSLAVVMGAPKLGDRDDPMSGKLILISLSGDSVKIIDEKVPLWNHLSFSVDGLNIVYQPLAKKNDGVQDTLLISKNIKNGNRHIVATGIQNRYILQRSISPDGRFMVFSSAEDLYLVPVTNAADNVLFDKSKTLPVIRFATGVDPYWEQNGQALCWTYGNHFYRINPDKVIAAAEKVLQNKDSIGMPNELSFISAPTLPDQKEYLNIAVPSSFGKGCIAFRNVRIITMKGNQIINNGCIVIKNGRISAIGATKFISIPKDANIFDLSGYTIMPGIIDLHLHSRIPPNIFPQQSWMYLTGLAYGITTARDPSLSFDSYGYSELLKAGQMIGPRLYTVGRAVRTSTLMKFDRFSDALEIVHKRWLLGGTVVKQYGLPSRENKQWLLQACNNFHLNMTNEGSYDPLALLGMIKDGSGGVEHNPAWGDIYKDIYIFLAGSKTFLTPTLQVCNGVENARLYFIDAFWKKFNKKLQHFWQGTLDLAILPKNSAEDTLHPGFLFPARITTNFFRHGANIGMGSHGNDQGIGAHNEIWALKMGGLSNMEVLRIATILGAKGLGVERDLGSLEIGKIADLVILNKDPLVDIHNTVDIKYVMKDGILYEGDNLNTIWPVKKECPLWTLKKNN